MSPPCVAGSPLLENDEDGADCRGEYQAGTSRARLVSILPMRRNWPLRQLLAILRGIALMVAVLLSLILLQLVPSLIRGGLSGVRDHIARVAIAGVPPERWGIAVLRMYEALSAIVLLACILFLAQRYLGRKVGSGGRAPERVAR
jgi:hypothetical protein